MGYQRLAAITDIAEGSVHTVHTRAGRIALTKLGDDIVAFEDVCTHDDGPLADGKIEGDVIICPRHGACFSMRTGEVLKMPATEPIEVFAVRINGADIEVDLG